MWALDIQLNGINMFGFYGLSVSLFFWYISVYLEHCAKERTNE